MGSPRVEHAILFARCTSIIYEMHGYIKSREKLRETGKKTERKNKKETRKTSGLEGGKSG